MSVIIPNIKMPMSCLVCPLAREIFGCLVCVGYFKDNLTGRRVYKSDLKESDADFNRPDWCPILPIPEGHGRLIDADALMEYFTSDSYWLNKLHKTQDGFDKETWTNEELRHLINKAPTIIPSEGGTE